MSIRRKINIIIFVLILAVGSFFYIYDKVNLSIGSFSEKQTILVEKGDNALVVGEKLASKNIISGKYYLIFYLWRNNQLHSLVAGVYEFSPGLKIPEIAKIITGGDVVPTSVPITFPEGWTAKDMSERLTANGFSGSDFLSMVNNPPRELREKYWFLAELKDDQTLEGYLFPDTYYFAKDATSQNIIEKMLTNFASKLNVNLKNDIADQKKSLRDVIIMASIIEKEAKFADDMKNISSVFWNRLEIGQRLQSDATLEYVLDDNKKQHSVDDLENQSPYNTYRFDGLPPGPVSNPGINAINAAIYPAKTDYYFFLTDLKTKKTIFAKNFTEHVANKDKYGL